MTLKNLLRGLWTVPYVVYGQFLVKLMSNPNLSSNSPFRVFFERKFDYSPEKANQINSMIYTISAFASPLCGYIVDKTGQNVLWIFLSTLVTIGAHALLAFTFLNPFIGMVTMGLAYSMLASSLWPLVALIIPEYQLGSAYGM